MARKLRGRVSGGRKAASGMILIFGLAFFNIALFSFSRLTLSDNQNKILPAQRLSSDRSRRSEVSIVDGMLMTTSSYQKTNRTKSDGLGTTKGKIASTSACLLMKDDNMLLDEWIAYHYYTAKLRYLVVAIDPTSTIPVAETQRTIFDKWMNETRRLAVKKYGKGRANDDFTLTIRTWSDQDFMPRAFLERGYHVHPQSIKINASKSMYHMGHEDPETVRRDWQLIHNHRFRQVTFLSACLRHTRDLGKQLVFHIDTDEFMTLSPVLVQQATTRGIGTSGPNKSLSSNGGILPPPSIQQPSQIAKFVYQTLYKDPELYKRANFPCSTMPRLLFGSVEDTNRQDQSTLAEITPKHLLDKSTFETLRWKYHTSYNDKERNAQPKVLVDVSRVTDSNDEMFRAKPFSIHRPSKKLCRRLDQINFRLYQKYPLIVHHYLGSLTRYMNGRPNDPRRSLATYLDKANVTSGKTLDSRDYPQYAIEGWLDGFVKMMGRDAALRLFGNRSKLVIPERNKP